MGLQYLKAAVATIGNPFFYPCSVRHLQREEGGWCRYPGFTAEILSIFANMINASIDAVPLYHRPTFEEMLTLIDYQNLTLSISTMTVTFDRFDKVSFLLPPVQYAHMAILIAPFLVRPHVSLLQPFQPTVWILGIASSIVTMLVMCGSHSPSRTTFLRFWYYLHFGRTVLLRKLGISMVAGTLVLWSLVALVAMRLYKCELVKDFTPDFSSQLELLRTRSSLADTLTNGSYRIVIGNKLFAEYKWFLHDGAFKKAMTLIPPIESMDIATHPVYNACQPGYIIFGLESTTLQYTHSLRPCLYYLEMRSAPVDLLTFALKRHSPLLRKLNSILSSLHEVGVLQKLEGKYKMVHAKYHMSKTRKDLGIAAAMELDSYIGPSLFMVGCLGIGIILLCGEIIQCAVSGRNLRTNVHEQEIKQVDQSRISRGLPILKSGPDSLVSSRRLNQAEVFNNQGWIGHD